MEISVGAILEGTIKSITKFGAFVTLPGGRSGLVHISEIAHSYVENVSDFLSEGQTVKVKVVNIDEAGRINLSIKKATPPPPRPQGFSRDVVGLRPGKHQLLFYNNDTEYIVFDDMYSYAAAKATTRTLRPPGWPQLQQRRRAVLRQPFRRPQLPPRRPLRCPPGRRPRRLRGSPEAVHAGLRQPSV